MGGSRKSSGTRSSNDVEEEGLERLAVDSVMVIAGGAHNRKGFTIDCEVWGEFVTVMETERVPVMPLPSLLPPPFLSLPDQLSRPDRGSGGPLYHPL